jgi:hypothetical protein
MSTILTMAEEIGGWVELSLVVAGRHGDYQCVSQGVTKKVPGWISGSRAQGSFCEAKRFNSAPPGKAVALLLQSWR